MDAAIEVETLTKRYGTTLAVDAIDFAVPPGATVGLLGGNGAGKTTTIAMLLGLLIPTAGRIRVLGFDMARERFTALARTLGVTLPAWEAGLARMIAALAAAGGLAG